MKLASLSSLGSLVKRYARRADSITERARSEGSALPGLSCAAPRLWRGVRCGARSARAAAELALFAAARQTELEQSSPSRRCAAGNPGRAALLAGADAPRQDTALGPCKHRHIARRVLNSRPWTDMPSLARLWAGGPGREFAAARSAARSGSPAAQRRAGEDCSSTVLPAQQAKKGEFRSRPGRASTAAHPAQGAGRRSLSALAHPPAALLAPTSERWYSRTPKSRAAKKWSCSASPRKRCLANC